MTRREALRLHRIERDRCLATRLTAYDRRQFQLVELRRIWSEWEVIEFRQHGMQPAARMLDEGPDLSGETGEV